MQLIKTFPRRIGEELLSAVLKAAAWLDENCPPQIKGEDSPHIGWWRRYALSLFLSRDTCAGAGAFCHMPGVQELFCEIDNLFILADQTMCQVFRAVQPNGDRVCGSSFLMAVVNQGGSGPHIDGEDWTDGCCCVIPFGEEWSGGELVFRDLGLGFALKPGDVIFFRSARLVHENLPFEGKRRSIVMTTDRNSFTAVNQPLDPHIIAQIEAYLLENRNRYSNMSQEQRKQLLRERVMAYNNVKNEPVIKVESNSTSDTKALLRAKLSKRIEKPVTPINPAIMQLLTHRMCIGKNPLSSKKSRAKPKRKPINKDEQAVGSNAKSRNLYRMK